MWFVLELGTVIEVRSDIVFGWGAAPLPFLSPGTFRDPPRGRKGVSGWKGRL